MSKKKGGVCIIDKYHVYTVTYKKDYALAIHYDFIYWVYITYICNRSEKRGENKFINMS